MYLNSHTIVRLSELKDEDGNFQNDATVTLESFVDRLTGAAVTGITLPLSMPYVPSSNGTYEAEIPYNTSVVVERFYTALVRAISVTGKRKDWMETIKVVHAVA
jgi:hypothetical protein